MNNTNLQDQKIFKDMRKSAEMNGQMYQTIGNHIGDSMLIQNEDTHNSTEDDHSKTRHEGSRPSNKFQWKQQLQMQRKKLNTQATQRPNNYRSQILNNQSVNNRTMKVLPSINNQSRLIPQLPAYNFQASDLSSQQTYQVKSSKGDRIKQRKLYNLLDNLQKPNVHNLKEIKKSINSLRPELVKPQPQQYKTPVQMQQSCLHQSVYQQVKNQSRNDKILKFSKTFILSKKIVNRGRQAIKDIQYTIPQRVSTQEREFMNKSALTNHHNTSTGRRNAVHLDERDLQKFNHQTSKSQEKPERLNSDDSDETSTPKDRNLNNASSLLHDRSKFQSPNRTISKLEIAHDPWILEQDFGEGDEEEDPDTFTPDEVTGLSIRKYLIEVEFIKACKLIAKLQKIRKENDIVGKTIRDIATQLEIDPVEIEGNIRDFIEKKKRFIKTRKHKCSDHMIPQDEQLDEFIKSYRKFLNFKHKLRLKLNHQTTDDEGVASLLQSLNEVQQGDILSKELFKMTEAMTMILKDPIFKVIESEEEYQMDQKRQLNKRMVEPSFKQMPDRGVFDINKSIRISQKSRDILQQVSTMLQQDNEQKRQNIKKDHGLVMLQFNNLKDHIAEQRHRDKVLIRMNPASQDSLQRIIRLRQTEISNIYLVYRINYAKNLQNLAVKEALTFKQRPQPHPKFKFHEESYEFNTRENKLSAQDQVLGQKAIKYLEMCAYIQHKKVHHQTDSVQLRKEPDDSYYSESSSDCHGAQENSLDSIEQIKDTHTTIDLFNEIEEREQFYNQAKQQIIGRNLPPTMESIFYHNCQQQKILSKPIFKSIVNNKFIFVGKDFGAGYGHALYDSIVENTEKTKHILELSFCDCNMKDSDFAAILRAIQNSKEFQPNLKRIIYSKNEISLQSIEQLKILLSGKYFTSLDINAPIMKKQDIRLLARVLTTSNDLQSLSMDNINLGDSQVIMDICEFITQNNKLQCISLQNSNLSGKSMILLLRALCDNIGIRKINLSNNGQSDIQQVNQATNALVCKLLGEILESHTQLIFLDISYLMLGKPLLHIIPLLRDSLRLNYLDLSGNLIGHGVWREQFQYCLPINQNENDILRCTRLSMQIDQFFSKAHDKHKTGQLLNNSRFASEQNYGFYSHLVNTNIIKEIKSKVLGPKEDSVLQTHQDNLILVRNTLNKEFVYNEVGIDDLSAFDYDKPKRWEISQKTQGLKTRGQYILVCVELSSFEQEFLEVKDDDEIKLLQSYYGLDSYYKEYLEALKLDQYKASILCQPLVFGTITNLKLFQMMKIYKFCTYQLINKAEDREMMEEQVFDETNNNMINNFKNTQSHIIQILQTFINTQSAQVIGLGLKPQALLSSQESRATFDQFLTRDCFIYTTNVVDSGSYGKHSVYIYNPQTNKIHKKIIVIDPNQHPYVAETVASQQISLEVPEKLKTKPIQLYKPFVNRINEWIIEDLNQLDLKDHKSLMDTQLADNILNSIEKYYQTLISFYTLTIQESENSYYPYLTREDLKNTKIYNAKLGELMNYKSIDRPKFMRFIILVYTRCHIEKSFEQFILEQIQPLVESSTLFTHKKDFDKLISPSMNEVFQNGELSKVTEYLNKTGSFSLQTIHLEISKKLPQANLLDLFKTYKLSHAQITNQLSTIEFLEFVYRVYKLLDSDNQEGDQRSEFDKYWQFMQDFIKSEMGPSDDKQAEDKVLELIEDDNVRKIYQKLI